MSGQTFFQNFEGRAEPTLDTALPVPRGKTEKKPMEESKKQNPSKSLPSWEKHQTKRYF